MKIGKVLLTAGFLFGLTVAANGAVSGSKATDDISIKIEIVTPLSVNIAKDEIDLGIHLSTDTLVGVSGTSDVTVAGGSGTSRTINLSAPDLVLTNQTDSSSDDEITISFDFTKTSFDFNSGDNSETTLMTAEVASLKIADSEPNVDSGVYTGTATVTATYN